MDPITWKGKSVTKDVARDILICASLQLFNEKVEGVPHILVSGDAGSGKSLLGNILFPSSVTSRVPLDAVGVGRYTTMGGRCLIKVDEGNSDFFSSKADMSTYMAMFESEWCCKTHGGRQTNAPCIMYISTNIRNPEQFFSNDGKFINKIL